MRYDIENVIECNHRPRASLLLSHEQDYKYFIRMLPHSGIVKRKGFFFRILNFHRCSRVVR